MEILLQIVSIAAGSQHAFLKELAIIDLVQTLLSDINGNHNDIYIALHTVQRQFELWDFPKFPLTHQAESILSRYQEGDIHDELKDSIEKLDELKTRYYKLCRSV